MGIIRAFSAKCDTCNNHRERTEWWVSGLKDDLREEGWRVLNLLTCPACLGTDPTYWDEDVFIV